MVALVTIDGARPDGIAKAATPCLDEIVKDGSFTWKARSVMPSVTLPCHTSIFRGIDPRHHGITSNTHGPFLRQSPSLFDVAHRAGLTCGMFFNWGQLRDLGDPESVHTSYCCLNTHLDDGDAHVTDKAIEAMGETDFDFLFLYLGHTDWNGHEHGWMSDEYIDAIGRADKCVGRLQNAMLKLAKPVDLIVIADHGGHDHGHGTDSPEDMTVPYVMWGYRVESGYQITRDVSLLDIAPTIATLLGTEIPEQWEGSAVLDAIRDTPQAKLHRSHTVFGLEDC